MESNHCDDRSGIRAILFDLDNTLIATRGADKLACNKMAETITQTYGVPTEIAKQSCKHFLQEFRKCPEHPSTHLDTWRHQLWYEALPPPYNKFSDAIYQHWIHLRYNFLQMSQDIINILKKLRKTYLIGLITNGPSKSQWEKIHKLNLKSLFDVILVSGDLPWEKPDEKIFETAYQYLGVRPEHCLMVGDKLETDILGGFQARLGGTVWVPLNINEMDSKFEPGPDFVIDNVTELPKMLKNSYKQPKLRRKSRDNLRPYNLKSFSEPDFSDCNSNGSDGS
ncbi:hypothetical protein WA026_015187 [Henosepilachna vigintioctopunctata]|uniref:N-acylneuraminate-9-phosphatase n=1 Tax=Henosepilachna vigintioctopunctata TaxID=420089 RepID=A0AAW1TV16_9CUCU